VVLGSLPGASRASADNGKPERSPQQTPQISDLLWRSQGEGSSGIYFEEHLPSQDLNVDGGPGEDVWSLLSIKSEYPGVQNSVVESHMLHPML
jgi:hypothetical protein